MVRLASQTAAWWQNRFRAMWLGISTWIRSDPVLVLISVGLGAATGLAVNRLVGPIRYSASAGVSIASNNNMQLPTGLMALASTAGLQLGNNAPPLAFQSALFESDPFRDSLLIEPVSAPLRDCPTNGPCLLYQAFGPGPRLTPWNLYRARKKLSDRLQDYRDERSEVLMITCEHRDSVTARVAVAQSVALLDRMNKRLVADAAQQRAAFLSGQLPRLVSDLQSIQDTLEQFYRHNISTGTSPELRFREARLRDTYDQQTQLLAGVRSQIAQNEIQARGELQLIQLVIPPAVSAKPERPLRNPALVLGMLLVGGLRFVRWRSRARGRPD